MAEHEIRAIVQPLYRQFYLRRGDAEWVSDQISDAGYERGLEAVDGFAYIGTTMYGNPINVVARVHAMAPRPPDADADRVAEDRLHGEGDVAILNWDPNEEPVATVPLPHGSIHIRASWYGMGEAASHADVDLGGEELSPERLTIDFWPSGS